MLNSNMMTIRYSLVCFVAFLLTFASMAQAEQNNSLSGKKEIKTEKTKEVNSKVAPVASNKDGKTEESSTSKYQEFLTNNKVETFRGEFITLHKNETSVYVEIELEQPQDILIGATIGRVSNSMLATTGMKVGMPRQYRISKRDSAVILQIPTSELLLVNPQERYSQAVANNFANMTTQSYNILAYNPERKSVVFDMTSFFMEENTLFPLFEGARFTPSYQSSQSYVSQVKAFQKNALVRTEKNFRLTIPNLNIPPQPLNLEVTYSIVKLEAEENGMIPRASDTRIGVFQTFKTMFDQATQQMESVTLVNRWRIEPADLDAFKRGELVEPQKKITFYVDDAFPESWKTAIKEGVLRWNSSFEKIGFKNVMQVFDFPKDNPDFDPDDIRYSCIRYVATPDENAMGPSWVDPRSGEIINASVFVYADITKLIQRWRFAQTAQLDPRTHSKHLHPDILHETLAYIMAHEIGHTLGFMHHMKASAAVPVESLRDVEYTQKNGTTPSIMDYARFNYVAQPEDKGVRLTPPDLGVYDDFLVKWTYSYFPDLGGDFIKESVRLKEMIAEKEHDKRFQYIMQQFGSYRYDPSAIEEDLSDHPEKAADYGLANVKYILNNLPKWITDDEDSYVKTDYYQGVALQAYMYASHVNMNVGGVYLTQASESSGIPRYQSVPKERQRSSALWLLDKAKNISSYNNAELEEKLYPDVRPFTVIGSLVQQMAVGNLLRVSLSYYLDSTTYTPTEYLEDVYLSVFEKTIKKKQNLTSEEKALQKQFSSFLSRTSRTAVTSMRLERGFTQEEMTSLLPDLPTTETLQAHLGMSSEPTLCGHTHHNQNSSFCSHHYQVANPNYGSRYGVPNDLWMQSVDKSLANTLIYAQKAQKLLRSAVKRTKNRQLKGHYQELLNMITKGIAGK